MKTYTVTPRDVVFDETNTVEITMGQFLSDIGGIEALQNLMVEIHSNNHTQERESGRHLHWLASQAALKLMMSKSKEHPDYVKGEALKTEGVYPMINSLALNWRHKFYDELVKLLPPEICNQCRPWEGPYEEFDGDTDSFKKRYP